MPKIFVLRHQLAEQQARLRQHDKGGEASNSPPLSSDEDNKYEGQPSLNNVSEVLPRPPPGLVIQPIPGPAPSSSAAGTSAVPPPPAPPAPSLPSTSSAANPNSTASGKQMFS